MVRMQPAVTYKQATAWISKVVAGRYDQVLFKPFWLLLFICKNLHHLREITINFSCLHHL